MCYTVDTQCLGPRMTRILHGVRMCYTGGLHAFLVPEYHGYDAKRVHTSNCVPRRCVYTVALERQSTHFLKTVYFI